MVGACVGTHTQLALNILRFLIGSVELFVLVTRTCREEVFVEVVGAMLCTALVDVESNAGCTFRRCEGGGGGGVNANDNLPNAA